MFKIKSEMIESIKQQLVVLGDTKVMEFWLTLTYPDIPVEKIRTMIRIAEAEIQHSKVEIVRELPHLLTYRARKELESSGADIKLAKTGIKKIRPTLPDEEIDDALSKVLSELEDEAKKGLPEAIIFYAMLQLRRSNKNMSMAKKRMRQYYPDIPDKHMDDILRMAKDRLD